MRRMRARLAPLIERARGAVDRLRDRFARRPSELPAAAQLVALEQPGATLGERPYDLLLIAAVLGLLGIGTVEIYSATAADALTHFHDSAHFLERQLAYLAVGGLAMWFGARLDYRKLRAWVYPLLVISVVLLAAALVMPARNGAKRWIPLGPL